MGTVIIIGVANKILSAILTAGYEHKPSVKKKIKANP
jgi:hypothetical protein